MSEKKRGGLSMPAGSASQALQELLKSERREAEEPGALPPIEDRQPDPTEAELPSHEAVKEASNEAVQEPVKPQSSTGRKPSVREYRKEAWWEGVKTHAKEGGQ